MSFMSRVAAVHDRARRPYFCATTERFKPYVMHSGLKTKHALGENAGKPTNLVLFANAELAMEHGRATYADSKDALVLIEVDPLAVKLPEDMGLRGQRGAPLGGFRPVEGIPPSALRFANPSNLREYGDTGIAMRR